MLSKLSTRKDNKNQTYDNAANADRNDDWCEKTKRNRERQREL